MRVMQAGPTYQEAPVRARNVGHVGPSHVPEALRFSSFLKLIYQLKISSIMEVNVSIK